MIREFLFFFLISGHILAQDTLFVCNPGDSIQFSTDLEGILYTWRPKSSLNDFSIPNPTARPFAETKYIVEVITGFKNINLVENPDFSMGNVGFTSDYPFVTSISTQGVFGISDSAAKLNGIFFEDCPDHTDGTGEMMVIDGSPVANEKVWCQKVEVKQNTSYAFSAWLTSVNPQNPAILVFSINDQQIGDPLTASPITCQWNQFYEIWDAENADSAQICIVNRNQNPAGNDFAMDDFSFIEIENINYDSVVVVVEALSEAARRKVFIPNAFSPNDDGFNDRFEIFLGKGALEISKMEIFDQWGNLFFMSQKCQNDPGCFWDGQVNGRPAKQGNYTYLLEILYFDGFREIKSGTITLLR